MTVTNVEEATILSGPSAAFYAEDGTAPVASYTAADPEGETIIWTLSGIDIDDFSTNGGEVEFRSQPDYDNPADADTDNIYLVTVGATAGTTAKVTTEVTVTVFTPVATTGNQVVGGVPTGAPTIVTSDDGTLGVGFPGGAADTSGGFQVLIDPNVEDCGVPVSGRRLTKCVGVAIYGLNGNELAEVALEEAFGSAEIDLVVGNTGSIAVHKREGPGQPWQSIPRCSGSGESDENECFVVSGRTFSVQNVRDFSEYAVTRSQARRSSSGRDDDDDDRGGVLTPEFAERVSAIRELAENSVAGALVGGPLTATESEGRQLSYSLGGEDAALFSIDPETGQILLGSGVVLDYESGRRTYTVDVVASSSVGGVSKTSVTVAVTNVDEPGTIFVSSDTGLMAGATLTARLTDPDGGVTGEAWQWQRSTDGTTWTDIEGAASASYFLTAADAGMLLWAAVSNADALGTGLSLAGEALPRVEAAPQPALTPQPTAIPTPGPADTPVAGAAPAPTATPEAPVLGATAVPTPTAVVPSAAPPATPTPWPSLAVRGPCNPRLRRPSLPSLPLRH